MLGQKLRIAVIVARQNTGGRIDDHAAFRLNRRRQPEMAAKNDAVAA